MVPYLANCAQKGGIALGLLAGMSLSAISGPLPIPAKPDNLVAGVQSKTAPVVDVAWHGHGGWRHGGWGHGGWGHGMWRHGGWGHGFGHGGWGWRHAGWRGGWGWRHAGWRGGWGWRHAGWHGGWGHGGWGWGHGWHHHHHGNNWAVVVGLPLLGYGAYCGWGSCGYPGPYAYPYGYYGY